MTLVIDADVAVMWFVDHADSHHAKAVIAMGDVMLARTTRSTTAFMLPSPSIDIITADHRFAEKLRISRRLRRVKVLDEIRG